MAKERNGQPDPLKDLYLARQLAEKGIPPCDDDFQGRHPTLFALMTRLWLDPTHKLSKAARIEVENNAGDWLFRLHSPAMGGHKQVLVKTIAEGLVALERAVNDATIPWNFYLTRKPRIKEENEKRKPLDL